MRCKDCGHRCNAKICEECFKLRVRFQSVSELTVRQLILRDANPTQKQKLAEVFSKA